MKYCVLRLLFFAALGSSAGAAATSAAPLPPAGDRELAQMLLKEMVESNTTHSVGSTDLAKAIQGHLIRAGFSSDDVTFIAPVEHPMKGNVVIRYRGKGRGRPVLFLGHLDVVDARREDWSVDPFQLTQDGEWFYGRGTLDMKDGDAALVETLIRLKREHFHPDRDVIVALTADEEAGGDANGPAFLLQEARPLIDAELAINLDSASGQYENGKRLYYSLGTSEKSYVTFTAQTTSAGGHGSLPGPDNAIYRLAAGLLRLSSWKFPVHTTATTRSYFAQRANFESSPVKEDMQQVAQESPDLAAADRLSADVKLNALLRTTCVATLISGGHAENALPQRAKATIQCRMMPGETAEQVQTALVGALADSAISLTVDAPPISSPESAPTVSLLKKAGQVIHSMWPGVAVVPAMATGFSDGRQTRNAGIPTYDLSGMWVDMGENRAHGRDERVGVREFYESVEYTYRLVKEVSKKD